MPFYCTQLLPWCTPRAQRKRAVTLSERSFEIIILISIVLQVKMSAFYVPQNATEKAYFDRLWDVANNRAVGGDLTVELLGQPAVQFFQRSGVDKGFLKQIWTMSTPGATMNVSQFHTALRYVAMIQNGEIPISPGMMLILLV